MDKLSRKKQAILFTTCLFSCLTLFSFAEETRALSPEKVRLVRRISEYWKEGDYKRAKKQILEFLEDSPDTIVSDHLHAMLGDTYFLESSYSQAIAAYSSIRSFEFHEKVFKNLLHCLFEQKEYKEIIRLVDERMSDLTAQESIPEEARLVFAAALFQLALGEAESEKTALLGKARKEYEQLSHGPYSAQALLPLAEITQVLQDFKSASELYTKLAGENPNFTESHLMTAACLEMSFDKEKAIKSFEAIYNLDGQYASKAAYNQMVLLFQEGKYQEFLDKKETFEKLLSSEKKPVLSFLVGRIHYSQENYPEAIEELKKYLVDANMRDPKHKNAIMTLFSSAEKLKDLELFDSFALQMRSFIENEKEFEQLLVAHANLCLEKSEPEKLQLDLIDLKERFPENTSRETLSFDNAILFSKNEEWEKSRAAFTAFTQDFPSSSLKEKAALYKMNCSIKEAEKASPDNMATIKQSLVSDLSEVLQNNTSLLEEQKQEYTLALGKTLYDLQEYERAAKFLEDYISTFTEESAPSDGLVLLSLCYLKSSSLEQFVLSAEKTLSLYPEIAQRDFLHLELYNAYISLGENNEENAKDLFLEKASDHLYTIFTSDKNKIKLENQLWLANYFVTKAKNTAHEEDMNKATQIYMGILFHNDDLSIQENTLFLEAEVLKLCELLDAQKNDALKVSLLEKLNLMQKTQPKLSWKFQRLTVFELANTYKKLSNTEKALELYDYLINSSAHVLSYHATAALLEKCKLTYSSLKDQIRNDQTEEKASEILDHLKDLQINKRLQSEPLHLEAALDYVDVRIYLAEPEAKQKAALFYMKKVKEDFSERQEGPSLEYHEARKLFPEKELVYQAYMQYIDMQIALLEASLAKASQDSELAEKLTKEAMDKLQELEVKKNSLPDYLQSRITNIASHTETHL
ncbi:MAG: hypothetical protein HKM07_04675 [Chlamydiae bacterium]|nr:hypothetical protein [Chlamydiota bacterium]